MFFLALFQLGQASDPIFLGFTDAQLDNNIIVSVNKVNDFFILI